MAFVDFLVDVDLLLVCVGGVYLVLAGEEGGLEERVATIFVYLYVSYI